MTKSAKFPIILISKIIIDDDKKSNHCLCFQRVSEGEILTTGHCAKNILELLTEREMSQVGLVGLRPLYLTEVDVL